MLFLDPKLQIVEVRDLFTLNKKPLVATIINFVLAE